MLVDARTIPDGTRIETDLCIVGAGAAGITLARELAGGGRRVVVLESGSLAEGTGGAAANPLGEGRIGGRPYFPLAEARHRGLGGTTAIWAGECRPLDAADFERHPAVSDTGWPFGPEELSPFYERARAVCRLGPEPFEAEEWRESGVRPLVPLGTGLRTAAFHVHRLHFGAAYRDELERATDVRVVSSATVTSLETDDPPRRVVAVRVGGPGRAGGFRVAARAFVLAAGGLENPRLLLLSDEAASGGLGNAYDLVGRYFMEHLYLDDAARLAAPDRRIDPFYTRGRERDGRLVRGILGLDPELRRREGMTNFCAVLVPTSPEERIRAARSVLIELAKGRVPVAAAARLRAGAGALAGRLGGRPVEPGVSVKTVAEQAPNPDSRIVLVRELDALGCRRIELRWRLSRIDKDTAHRGHRILADAFAAAGIGFTSLLGRPDDPWPERLRGARHHMGTTRMHADPRRGVVDPDGRVHGIENLYVAGSSVFPTGGAANPTFTIVALALRLADTLGERLR